jgi:predicted AAA+ superfamily ATPase
MITELLKARLNEGAEDNLYFWRDKTGNEIDLLADDAGHLQIYEMKSAETISSDFFAGLDYFTKLHSGVQQRLLVYGGKQMQTRSNGIRVTPWNEL